MRHLQVSDGIQVLTLGKVSCQLRPQNRPSSCVYLLHDAACLLGHFYSDLGLHVYKEVEGCQAEPVSIHWQWYTLLFLLS